MEKIELINKIISIVFSICYFYQIIYILIPFIIRERAPKKAEKLHKYAVLISARNEEAVITQLIDSIRDQSYPGDLVTVFVVADNCTDHTADAARRAGAAVYERFNTVNVGKGFALDYLLGKIRADYPKGEFDGFFVFDADNLLDESFISEMNKTFSAGHEIITSCRNSKNYATNWISAGYSLWFLRESKYLNYPRMLIGSSCAVSGTGFLVSGRIIEENDGWKFFTLTEDIEFAVHSVINGRRIAYCNTAVLYDEQPFTFRQAWNQRLRWAKGFFQVFRKYGAGLLGGMVRRRSWSCFDLLMTIMPAIFLTVFCVGTNLAAMLATLPVGGGDPMVVVKSLLSTGLNAYLLLFAVGGITVVTQWKMIHCKPVFKILYLFTFPLFMFTYVPITLVAIFKRVEWTPIAHTEVKTLQEVRGETAGRM